MREVGWFLGRCSIAGMARGMYALAIASVCLFGGSALSQQSDCLFGGEEFYRANTIGNEYYDTIDGACEDHVFNHVAAAERDYQGYVVQNGYSGEHLTRLTFTCMYRIKRFSNSEWEDRTVDGANLCIRGGVEFSGFCEPVPDCVTCGDGGGGGAGAGAPSPNPGPHSAGNPIDIAYGMKTEHVTDWASPKDARFSFQRFYNSTDTASRVDGYREYGLGWSSNWSYTRVRSTNFFSGEHFVRAPGGRSIGFDSYSDYRPMREDLPFHTYDDPEDERVHLFEDGSGWQLTFTPFIEVTGYDVHFPSRMSWSDGYAISFTRDVEGRLLVAQDNRGQRAEFTWAPGIEGSSLYDVISTVDIDAAYDGADFTPQVRITYTYSPTDSQAFGRTLERVQAQTIASSEVLSDWSYDYVPGLAANGGPLLQGTYDGRLDGDGQPIKLAEFAYGETDPDVRVPRAISTQRFGADSRFLIDTMGDDQVKVTNPLGKETDYLFEQIGGVRRPTQINGVPTPSCLGTALAFDYTPTADGPEGYVYERIERNGSRTTFERDDRGLVLTKTEDADGATPRVTTYTWHETLRLPLTKTTSQMRERFRYDDDGLLTQYTQTDVLVGSPSNGAERVWTYQFTTLDSGLKVLTSLDGPGLAADGIDDVTEYTYHPDGTLATVTDPNGLITQYLDYNDLGQATRIVDAAGIATALTYDEEGQLLEVIENADQNSGQRSTFTYDIIGQMTSFTTSGAEVWTLTYNEARRLVSMETSAGEVMAFDYDLAGNATSTIYRQANGTQVFAETAAFDELSRLREMLGALGQRVSFTYDEEDNLATAVDALTHTAGNAYDALNRVVSVIDRDDGDTALAYNDANRVTAVDDQRQLQTRYTYNGFGDLIEETSPDRGTTTYAYDSRGFVTAMTDARGVESLYEYDDGGRVTALRFPSDPTQDQDFRYDYSANDNQGEGRLDRVDDESGYLQRRYQDGGYVSQDRRRITNRTYNTAYKVDTKGRIQRLQTPGKLELVYTYDRQDRVTRITAQRRIRDPETGQFPPRRNVVFGASYMPFGDLRSYRYGDGASQTRTYDLSYRLTRQRDGLGGSFLRDVIYGWTARDNLRVASDVLDAQRTETYAYSPREFMAQATGAYGQLNFAYDAVGNRTRRTVSGAVDTYTYAAPSNRLDTIALAAGGARSFTYDAAGNVIADERDGQVYSYTYNAANRMDSFSIDGVLQEEYLYNALGQQVLRRMASTGKSIHVIHDLDGNRLAEYEIDNATGQQSLLQEYIWFNGEPVAVVDGQTDEIFFVRADHIGRPIFATDSSGAQVWEASYLPFGGVHVGSTDAIALRFPGQWFHAESGLHQNWMRDYDPTTGRYLQADPLGLVAGASLYGYGRQNPAIYIDPDGEHPLLAAAALAGLASLAFDFAFDQLFGDQCYTWEEALTAFALGAVTGGGGFAATGIKRAGREFSHAIPGRTLKRSGFGRRLDKRSNTYRSLNGNYVSPKFHSWTDPLRFLKGQRKATKPMLHPAARPFARAPLWSYGAFAGMFAPSGCACRE